MPLAAYGFNPNPRIISTEISTVIPTNNHATINTMISTMIPFITNYINYTDSKTNKYDIIPSYIQNKMDYSDNIIFYSSDIYNNNLNKGKNNIISINDFIDYYDKKIRPYAEDTNDILNK